MSGEIMSSKWVNGRFASISALLAAGVALTACATGCSETQRPPRIEDDARQMAPIPACIMRLPPRTGQKGFVRNLHERQYWELVFPAFDAQSRQLPKDATTCTGRAVFTDAIFNGGDSARGWPRVVELGDEGETKKDEGDILFGSGGNRLKILWMRTHEWPDETAAGPLVLVRTLEDYAELYAVGAYKGPAQRGHRPYFQIERMGSEAVVTAEVDGCVGADVTKPCENQVTVFLPRRGQLVALTTIPLEQHGYALGGEPGMAGRTEYKGTSTPTYVDGGIKLVEQVTVTDDAGRVVRKADRNRFLMLKDNVLEADSPPLFPQIYPKQTAR